MALAWYPYGVTPGGGNPPSASPSTAPRESHSSRSHGGQALASGLLVGFGVLAMVACVVGLFVVGTTPGAKPPVPPSASVSSARPALTPQLPAAAPLSPGDTSEWNEEPAQAPPLDEGERVASPQDELAPLTVTSADAVWGKADAPVTLVSFLDLECGFSRQLLPDLVRLKAEFDSDLRWVYKHRPLADHALGAHAARTFAKVHGVYGKVGMFRLALEAAASEEPLGANVLDSWITRAKLDPSRLAGEGVESAAAARVDADLELAALYGLRSTPVLFVNGIRIDGLRPLSQLRAAIARELATARWLAAAGMPRSSIHLQRTRYNLLGVGEDAPSRECVPVDGSPALGAETPLVTVVQFSDYECRFCKQSAPLLKALLSRFKGQIKLVSKSYPLPQHEQARAAAKFALEARELGGDRAFWRVHELLLAEPNDLDESVLAAVARRAGLPEKPLLAAARSDRHEAAIAADVELAEKLEVEGVPTFFVNGRRVSGVASAASFENLVIEELASARKIASASRGPGAIERLLCSAGL